MAIKTISQFDEATPTKSDRILIEQNGEGKNTVLIDCIYPVGTIYLSLNDVSPSSFIGGSWEKLPEGKALWTASSGAGNSIEAGLPNIYGDAVFNSRTRNGEYTVWLRSIPASTPNAFKIVPNSLESSCGVSIDVELSTSRPHTVFDASSYNPIYGKSSTVQPPAYKVYAWKRVA